MENASFLLVFGLYIAIHVHLYIDLYVAIQKI